MGVGGEPAAPGSPGPGGWGPAVPGSPGPGGISQNVASRILFSCSFSFEEAGVFAFS